MANFLTTQTKSLKGFIKVPGDKSISHRAIIIGSIAKGVTNICGFLQGEDSLSTLKAFQDMGVEIERDNTNVIINGVGMYGLKKPEKSIYLGNSGTSIRLMSGILSAQNFNSKLYGDKSLSNRPMNRIISPLTKMGAKIYSKKDNKPPLYIESVDKLDAINYELPVASAQIKSAILLAGLYAKGKTVITEPLITRDHTERMLINFGYDVNSSNKEISINGGGELQACDIKIPSDISSAAFFMVAGIIAKDSDLTIRDVNINPTRIGVIKILELMGANIKILNKSVCAGEYIADINVKSSNLQGIKIPENLIPLAIDEFPIIFIAASCAKGQTILMGAKELRVKESDRIQAMSEGLSILGIENEILEDGIIINGGSFNKPSLTINSHLDHRIAMSFAIASIRCEHRIEISDVDNVKTSFPNFVDICQKIGINIEEIT